MPTCSLTITNIKISIGETLENHFSSLTKMWRFKAFCSRATCHSVFSDTNQSWPTFSFSHADPCAPQHSNYQVLLMLCLIGVDTFTKHVTPLTLSVSIRHSYMWTYSDHCFEMKLWCRNSCIHFTSPLRLVLKIIMNAHTCNTLQTFLFHFPSYSLSVQIDSHLCGVGLYVTLRFV